MSSIGLVNLRYHCAGSSRICEKQTITAGAFRGYKEINLRALRLLNADGYLITNSCSFHMNEQLFGKCWQKR